MEKLIKKFNDQKKEEHGKEYAERLWNESWTYIKTVVDTVREPFLILDKDLCVMAANESFYRTFQVEEKDTENKLVYKLGNGQWDIPSLRKLLEDILPQNSFFKGFEVAHDFPHIGRKVMILNARRIYEERNGQNSFPPIILLAMEDVTEMMDVAEMLAKRTTMFEVEMAERTGKLESQIKDLEKLINRFQKKD